jgi:hypothetical protein
MTTAGTRFERDTAVEHVGDGHYRGTVDPGWSIEGAPNGGYLMAMAARAMRDPVPHPDPVTITAHYLAVPEPGPVDVLVEVVREGRRHATVAGRLLQGEREHVRLLATFSDLAAADGPCWVDRQPPRLPPIEECVDASAMDVERAHAAGSAVSPIVERLERLVPERVTGWADGRPSGRGEMGGWTRWPDAEVVDTLGLLVVADGYPPAVFNAGDTGLGWVPTVELTVQVRKRPAPGHLAAWFTTTAVTGGYLEEDGEIWDAEGDLVVLSRQLALAAQ